MLLDPTNFLLFLLLFSLGIGAGTYLLFTHYVTRLLVVNAVVFFLSALRVASEYYIQSLPTFADVERYAPWHILPVNALVPLQWLLVWQYVRPLRGWRWERMANRLVTFGLFLLPFVPHQYFTSLADPAIFYYHPERIDGYWQFAVRTELWYFSVYRTHTNLMLLLVTGALAVGIVRNDKNRLRQSFLLLSYFLLPSLYFALTRSGEWNVPATGVVFLFHTLIISWYVTSYRLFRNNIDLVTGDLLDSVSDLTISTDPDLRITRVNRLTAATLKLDSRHLSDWLRQQDKQGGKDAGSILSELTDGTRAEQVLLLEDRSGTQRTFNLRVTPYRNGDRLLGYTFLLTDLTDIRAKERELSDLNATKDRLFSIIGHDLRRSALAFRGIGAKVKYLLDQDDPPRLLALTKRLEQAAFTLNSQLDNLLNWALQQRGMLSYRPRAVELADLLLELRDTFKEIARAKEVTLWFDTERPTTVYADPHALMTILRNLTDNAIKFTPAGGTVRIEHRREGTTVRVAVTDTGIGIPPAALADVFTLGGHPSRTGTAGEKGTGYGLSLVAELIKINGGTISVSNRVGEGTVFTIVLPDSYQGTVLPNSESQASGAPD